MKSLRVSIGRLILSDPLIPHYVLSPDVRGRGQRDDRRTVHVSPRSPTMKATLRTLIALLLVSAGLAWASAGEVTELAPAAPAPADHPQQIDDEAQDEQELTSEDLLAMDPDKVDAGACCMADCFEERAACKEACGFFNQPCLEQCQVEFEACRSNC
jgi:hypothetical protein